MATANRTRAEQADQAVLIPAVAYLRCSSDQQIDASIPAQKTAIERWATENGYTIIRWYVDEGISGWKEDRQAFQQMIDDAEHRGDFRAVVVWDQNRFSRFPPVEACYYWHRLDKAQVHLASVNQGRVEWNSIAGFLTATIKQHADAQHRFQLSADVKRGKRAVAERGLWQGKIPFGYIVVDRRLQLGDPMRVEIVRRIFREYIEGRSLTSIAHRLNADGVYVADQGRHCLPHSIRAKLINPAYVGTFRWDDIEIKDNHPAIISQADFDTVQRLLVERQKVTTPKRDGGEFLFTSILRCGKCNSAMHGQANGPRIYYWCQGFKMRGASYCDLNNAKQADVLGCVVDTIEAHWMNPKVVSRLRSAVHELVDAEHPKMDGGQIEGQLTALDAKLAKAKKRLVECDSDMLPDVQEAIRALRSQREQLETALRACSTPKVTLYAQADERIDTAVSLFCGLRQELAAADVVRQREILRETVSSIKVWSERNGPQDRYRLDRGEIELRADNLFNSPD